MRQVARAALLGAVCGCTPVPPDHDLEVVQGSVLATWTPNGYRSTATRRTLQSLRRMGATDLGVLTTWYQTGTTGTDIAADPDRTPDEGALIYAIREAQELGLRVTLKPHLDVADGTWRGEIRPAGAEATAAWFEAYTAFAVYHAELAADLGVHALVVGTEHKAMEHDARWRDVIAAARAAYDGELIYAANWDSYADVAWWDAVDVIGVDAYFPLTDSRTPADAVLREAWAYRMGQIEDFAAAQVRPVVFAELGYQARDGANMSPWWAPTTVPDAAEQAACLDAALDALGASSVRGALLWKTYPDPENDPDGFDFVGRQAQAVVEAAWAR